MYIKYILIVKRFRDFFTLSVYGYNANYYNTYNEDDEVARYYYVICFPLVIY